MSGELNDIRPGLLIMGISPFAFLAIGFYLAPDAAMRTLLPATIAWLLGALVVAPRVGEALERRSQHGMVLVATVIPETSLIFCFVGTVLSDLPHGIPEAGLLVLGASAVVTLVAQALILRGAPDDAFRPEGFGRFLVRFVAVESLVICGLVFFLLEWSQIA